MKKTATKIISLLLIAAMLVTTAVMFASCNNKPSNGGADLVDLNFGGEDFTFLISTRSGVNGFNDFTYDENSTLVLDDAIYRRNLAVEEKYGVKITTIEDRSAVNPNGKSLIIKAYTSGDTNYDAAECVAYDVSALAYSSYLSDLNALPHLNLQNEWWDQKANSDLAINGVMFFTTGDFGVWANDVTYCIPFNKALADTKGVGSDELYQLVKDGKWTIEALANATKKVSEDLNGDQTYDVNDMFGLTTWDDAIYGVVNAAGEKCCTIADDGTIKLSLNNERVISAIEQYMTLYNQKEYVINFQNTTAASHDDAITQLFSNGNSLFLMIMFKNLVAIRDTSLDYGILPYPKLDEAQTEYGSTVAPWHTTFLCVPSLIASEEKTGAVLEALAALSTDTVTKAYYEKTLVGRSVRDDESVEMLDIIFASRVFDIGYYYQPGNINKQLITALVRKRSMDFASMYATYETTAQSDLDSINAFFAQVLADRQ